LQKDLPTRSSEAFRWPDSSKIGISDARFVDFVRRRLW
jgi:hypothetical protein